MKAVIQKWTHCPHDINSPSSQSNRWREILYKLSKKQFLYFQIFDCQELSASKSAKVSTLSRQKISHVHAMYM